MRQQCVGRHVGGVSTDALADVSTNMSVGSDSVPLPRNHWLSISGTLSRCLQKAWHFLACLG